MSLLGACLSLRCCKRLRLSNMAASASGGAPPASWLAACHASAAHGLPGAPATQALPLSGNVTKARDTASLVSAWCIMLVARRSADIAASDASSGNQGSLESCHL